MWCCVRGPDRRRRRRRRRTTTLVVGGWVGGRGSVGPDRWSALGRGAAAAGHVPGPPRGSLPPRPSSQRAPPTAPADQAPQPAGGASVSALYVCSSAPGHGATLCQILRKSVFRSFFTPHRALPQAENGALQAAWAPSKDAWDRRVRSGSLPKGTAGERPPSPGPQRRTRGVQEPSTWTLKRTRQGPCNGESRKPLDQSPKSATGEP